MKFFLVTLVALAVIVLIAVRLLRGRVPVETKTTTGGQAVPLSARRVADVVAVAITLDINEKPSLFVMLAADGTVNRMGTGTLENTERDLFVGRIDPAIFKAVQSQLTEAMIQGLGETFQHQNPRGVPCKLTLKFQFKDKTWDGFAYLYGSESGGMPQDVADFVTAAVRQTDPWYENFKRTTAEQRK